MRLPQITITCDCGAAGTVDFGGSWTCEACGRTWDTRQIPPDEYQDVIHRLRRYRALVLGPPFALAAVLVPLSILNSIRFAFLLFVLVLAHGLLIVPPLRRRAAARIHDAAPRWNLRPSDPSAT